MLPMVEIPCPETGIISALPAMEFGLYAMRLGADAVAVKSDALNYETGIVLKRKLEIPFKGRNCYKVYTNGKISPQLVTDFQRIC